MRKLLPWFLAVATLGCSPHAPSPIPGPTPTPWPEVSFPGPKVSFQPSSISIGFGSLLLPPDKIVEDSFIVTFPQPVHVSRIWSFIGVDSGNLGEFAIDVSADGRVYQRSLHKETVGIYDAWADEPVDFTVESLRIHTLGHMLATSGHLELELILETEP